MAAPATCATNASIRTFTAAASDPPPASSCSITGNSHPHHPASSTPDAGTIRGTTNNTSNRLTKYY